MPKQTGGRTTDTRQLILKEAEKLYYTGGYDHINLQVLADQLHITKAALFHHFKNKACLFFETLLAILEHMRQMFEAVIAQGDPSTRARLMRAMEQLALEPAFDIVRFQREEMKVLDPQQQQEIRQAWSAGTFDIVKRIFQEGMLQGDLKEHDATMAASLFLNICLLLPRASDPVRTLPMHESRDLSITNMLSMLLDGLGRPVSDVP